MVSRVAGSALKNIGMEELITHNYEEYKNKILFIANNPKYFNEIKDKIKRNRLQTKLFDTKAFTKNLEEEYKRLFISWKNSK